MGFGGITCCKHELVSRERCPLIVLRMVWAAVCLGKLLLMARKEEKELDDTKEEPCKEVYGRLAKGFFKTWYATYKVAVCEAYDPLAMEGKATVLILL